MQQSRQSQRVKKEMDKLVLVQKADNSLPMRLKHLPVLSHKNQATMQVFLHNTLLFHNRICQQTVVSHRTQLLSIKKSFPKNVVKERPVALADVALRF